MTKKTLFEDALILSVCKVLRALVKVTPFAISLWVAKRIGTLIYLFGKRRKIALKNLRAAFSTELGASTMSRVAHRSVQNLTMSAVELLRFPDMTSRYLEKHIRIEGTEKFEPWMSQKKGIIFLTAHFGNWELLNAAAGLLGYPMVVLARNQKHPRSDEFLNSLRASKGSQIIHKGMPIREILRALKVGKIVGMLSDQDGGKKGTFVNFFNRLSSSPSGVATFAIRTGAPIFPVFIFRENDMHHRVEVEGPLKFPDNRLSAEEQEKIILQQFANILEEKIRKAPDQWLWAHRRWKSTPDRSVLILTDGKSGHLHQSRMVADALQEERRSSFEGARAPIKVLPVDYRSVWHRRLLDLMLRVTRGYLPLGPSGFRFFVTRACFDAIQKTNADVVISCGSSLVGPNLFVRALNQAKSLVIMKPFVPAKRFEAVLVPRHDRLKPGVNVFYTHGAISSLDLRRIEEDGLKLMADISAKSTDRYMGLLLGGDVDGLHFEKNALSETLEAIGRYSAVSGVQVLATTSRRTPRWADELVKQSFLNKDVCPLLVIANEANREGIVSGILGLSRIVIVSGESMSMVSEAVSSGKKVVVIIPSAKQVLKSKHQAFLNMLTAKGLASVAPAGRVYETIEQCFSAPESHSSPEHIAEDRQAIFNAIARVV